MKNRISKAILYFKKDKKFFLFKTLFVFFKMSPIKYIVPSRLWLIVQYRVRVNKRLNLKDPKTYNEKLQWLKIHDRKPKYTQWVDKFEVRKYIAKTIGEEYLIPLIGVWNKFEEIDFSRLPNKFVLKCTHDSGGVIICIDKNEFDVELARIKINRFLKRNYYYSGREWPYKNVKPRIIAEKFLEVEKNEIPKNYKLWTFSGRVEFINVHYIENKETKINIYNRNWKMQNFGMVYKNNLNIHHEKPKNIDKMIIFAEKLGANQEFLRVDFYEIHNHIYFGELTLYPTSGFIKFHSEHERIDSLYGRMLKI